MARPRQSEHMKESLDRAGKKATLLLYEGADHYLQGPSSTRILEDMERFLAEHLGS